MILSLRPRFIFFKTRKTAGTSIELHLSGSCGDDDVLTPLGPYVSSYPARNHGAFFNHVPAATVRDAVDPAVWSGYLKFCVVRNPWDRALSFFHMMRNAPGFGGRHASMTLDEFLATGPDCDDRPIYADPRTGATLVDAVLRYERLDADLGALLGRLGVPFDGTLAIRAKGQFRTDRRPYREVLSAAQAERIRARYAAEIEAWGYAF